LGRNRNVTRRVLRTAGSLCRNALQQRCGQNARNKRRQRDQRD
jgi:hypothetical protein